MPKKVRSIYILAKEVVNHALLEAQSVVRALAADPSIVNKALGKAKADPLKTKL